MESWEDFDTTFSFKRDLSYDQKLIEQIASNRRAFDNVLFVDRLLKVLNIDAGIIISRSFSILKDENVVKY